MAATLLPITTSSEQPLGVSTYSPIDTSAIENLLGSILLELRTMNWYMIEGFQIKTIGPANDYRGYKADTDGGLNRPTSGFA